MKVLRNSFFLIFICSCASSNYLTSVSYLKSKKIGHLKSNVSICISKNIKVELDDSNKFQVVEYKKGLKNGKTHYFENNCYLGYGTFKNGKRNGYCVSYFCQGQVSNISWYKKDSLIWSRTLGINFR